MDILLYWGYILSQYTYLLLSISIWTDGNLTTDTMDDNKQLKIKLQSVLSRFHKISSQLFNCQDYPIHLSWACIFTEPGPRLL